MSEAGLTSVGRILRDSRESQGMSLDDVAARLRLMHRQIEAMETDDFESLGRPVFARGFVRNYARLLGLAPDPLLMRMEGAPAEPTVVSRPEPAMPRSWLSSPWLILLSLGVLLAVVVPVALYWWLNSAVDEVPPRPARVVEAQPKAVAPVGAAPLAPPVPAAVPVHEPASPAAVQPSAVQPPAAEQAPEAAPREPAADGAVHLELGGEAWVEIKDAGGHTLLRQLKPAGSSVDAHGQPPFDVVIGNASQARMTYNGRPIDLKPFIDGTVARFTLEE
jgi:cytoskeleton protein RodZ